MTTPNQLSNNILRSSIITSNNQLNQPNQLNQQNQPNYIKPVEITDVLLSYKKKYNNFNIICSIIALIISWNCNKNNPFYLKSLYGIIAILLSYWYILFYLIYYVLLKKDCKDDPVIEIKFKNLLKK